MEIIYTEEQIRENKNLRDILNIDSLTLDIIYNFYLNDPDKVMIRNRPIGFKDSSCYCGRITSFLTLGLTFNIIPYSEEVEGLTHYANIKKIIPAFMEMISVLKIEEE